MPISPERYLKMSMSEIGVPELHTVNPAQQLLNRFDFALANADARLGQTLWQQIVTLPTIIPVVTFSGENPPPDTLPGVDTLQKMAEQGQGASDFGKEIREQLHLLITTDYVSVLKNIQKEMFVPVGQVLRWGAHESAQIMNYLSTDQGILMLSCVGAAIFAGTQTIRSIKENRRSIPRDSKKNRKAHNLFRNY